MKPWRELLFEETQTLHPFHVGLRMIKTVVAVFICALIGWARGEASIFSLIAAVLCMQNSTEKTLYMAFNRVMGTAIGGVYGVLVVFLETQFHVQRLMPLYYLLVSVMLIPVICTTLAVRKPAVSAFACIVFTSTTFHYVGDSNAYAYALNRLLDTLIGIAVALVVNLSLPTPKLPAAAEAETAEAGEAVEAEEAEKKD